MRKSIGSPFHQNNHPYLFLEPALFADTVSLELTLDYFSGPWAGGKFNIVFKDYTCLDDEGEEEACICEATFDESMCTSCNVCALEGQGGNDFDCTNVNNKVVRTCTGIRALIHQRLTQCQSQSLEPLLCPLWNLLQGQQ